MDHGNREDLSLAGLLMRDLIVLFVMGQKVRRG